MPNLKQSNRRQDDVRSSVSERLSAGIQTALQYINQVDKKKLEKLLEELREAYGDWASVFREVQMQFGELWEVLGEFESKLTDWKRVDPALGPEGKWGPVSLSKRGYHFAAGLVKGDDPRAKKWMIVHFAHLDSRQNGMGDERDFGLQSDPAEQLVGLDACQSGMTEKTLGRVHDLLSRVKGFEYIFDLHHATLGQRRIHIHPDRMKGRKVADFCIQLMIALNQDDIKQVYDLADRANVKLLENKSKKVRWRS